MVALASIAQQQADPIGGWLPLLSYGTSTLLVVVGVYFFIFHWYPSQQKREEAQRQDRVAERERVEVLRREEREKFLAALDRVSTTTAELARQQAEATRQQAEAARQQADTARQQAEVSRQQTETIKQHTDVVRSFAEQLREVREQARRRPS